MAPARNDIPEGIYSLLDTDLYKLTMQSAVLKFFPKVEVTYSFTNRTPGMKLNRAAYNWLQQQILNLKNIRVTDGELQFLRKQCPYLSEAYLDFLRTFALRPSEQVECSFTPDTNTGSDEDHGDLHLATKGLWIETILYEIPLLALTSEAYFKFCDKDWTYENQVAKAKKKGIRLIENGCLVSEFGCRRRRDYHTQELVLQGLIEAQEECASKGLQGKFVGTSNVHFAMRFGVTPVGTVAHEWFMGVAAITGSYPSATETALSYWIATFGKGVLSIALTDTFGTPHFLEVFKNPIGLPADVNSTTQSAERFADVFVGTRQDSGDPLEFVRTMRAFYDKEGITDRKTIVFSDALNVEKCIEYRDVAEKAGFAPSFGVGTFLTNDYVRASDGGKSAPLNIVIKLASANGKPAVKISDNIGKNTGDEAVVDDVKRQLGYTERNWDEGDEKTRWGVDGATA